MLRFAHRFDLRRAAKLAALACAVALLGAPFALADGEAAASASERADALFVRDALARLLDEMGVANANDDAHEAPSQQRSYSFPAATVRDLCAAMCERFRRDGIVTSDCVRSCAQAELPARGEPASATAASTPPTRPVPQADPAAASRVEGARAHERAPRGSEAPCAHDSRSRSPSSC